LSREAATPAGATFFYKYRQYLDGILLFSIFYFISSPIPIPIFIFIFIFIFPS